MSASRVVRVALGQMRVTPGAPDENLARAEAWMAHAAADGAQVIVLPETLDLGWNAAEARALAEPLPGPRSQRLCSAAARHGVVLAAGLTERAGDRVYNSAVLIDADGRLVATHRKIAELDFARANYTAGTHLGVTDTSIGRVGIAICADLWEPTLGRALGAMGAEIILSPSAWAVPPDFNHAYTPYGREWIASYRDVSEAFGIPVVGVSNVGPIRHGAWAGHVCIGASLAVSGDGRVAAQGPVGVDAEWLQVLDLQLSL
jgi:predicted amidohydrolase